jgi:hypothetical protein
LLLLYRLMDLTKRQKNMSTYFLIAALSVMLGNMYAVQNSLLLKSWANTPQMLDAQFGKDFVNVQVNPGNTLDNSSSTLGLNSGNANQSTSGLSEGGGTTGMSSSNETGTESANQSTSGLSEGGGTTGMSSSNETGTESANQSMGGLSGGEGTSGMSSSNETGTESANQSTSGLSQEQAINENTSQTTQTEQNLNQTQTNNQQVNVNNTINNNVNNQIQLNQRLENIITEREGEKPIPLEEQKRIESQDIIVIREHKALTGPDCRSGNVLNGASNEKDLKVLSKCQDAVGIVKHTKKMDDGDYKFFLEVDSKYNFLLNDKNRDKTDGFLVVEIVPKDQNAKTVDLPKEGDKVHIWGAWVTDKPKGWHEIHPAWKVVKE